MELRGKRQIDGITSALKGFEWAHAIRSFPWPEISQVFPGSTNCNPINSMVMLYIHGPLCLRNVN